jgi:hypothetical protein
MTYKILGITTAIFLTLFALFEFTMYARGALSTDVPAMITQYRVYDLLASTTAETTVATSTSATSTNIVAYNDSSGRIIDGTVDMRGAKKIVLYLSSGGLTHANTGTSTFRVQTSRDGTNWDNYQMLIPATSTTPTFSYVPQVVLPITNTGPATTTVVYFMDVQGGYSKLRCNVWMSGTMEAGCAVGVTY